MWTQKFQAQPTNASFATFNQVFGGSSQLPTTVERVVIKSLRQGNSASSCWKLGGAAEHLIDGGKKCILSIEL